MIKMPRILVAEDESDIRRLVKMLLREQHTPDIVSDGQQAIDNITESQEPYDLVLTDMDMPTNGYAVLDYVRSQKTYDCVPVILMSANVREENKETFKARGFDYLIEKPFKSNIFCETVEKALKEGRLKPE